MKLVIIRHGDPDYTIDSLTEKGWKEAEYLSERISKLEVRDFYVSSMGRAKDTASLTLKKMGQTATECEWLREFSPLIHRPDDKNEVHIAWDWLPQDWTQEERYYDYKTWADTPIMQEGKVREEYDWVIQNLDALLSSYGYVREGHYYRVEKSNRDTIVFFCHFGLGCVLLSHLLGISPMPLWHGLCAAPTSVTVLTTEERREGIASFRMSSYGDISHLYVKEEKPAFAARFCETYDSSWERHD